MVRGPERQNSGKTAEYATDAATNALLLAPGRSLAFTSALEANVDPMKARARAPISDSVNPMPLAMSDIVGGTMLLVALNANVTVTITARAPA
jgi:hypothetical protein